MSLRAVAWKLRAGKWLQVQAIYGYEICCIYENIFHVPRFVYGKQHDGLTYHSRVKFSLYSDVIMDTVASQTTSLTIVYSAIYSDADQRKHQSSAPQAFLRWIPRTSGQ